MSEAFERKSRVVVVTGGPAKQTIVGSHRGLASAR